MDITYINSKNIKISISREELYENGLDAESLDYTKTRTKRFIWELLDIAYIKTGFNAGNGRLFVRVFPSADGGCELFITKNADFSEKDGKSDTCIAQTENENEDLACVTDDADKLYMLCGRLKTAGFCGDSSLYSGTGDSFILVFNSQRKLPSYINKKFCGEKKDYFFAADYGKMFTVTPEMKAYICEHCHLVCAECAVEKIMG